MYSKIIYVSYSWDSEEHIKAVKKFIDELKSNGLTIISDEDMKIGESIEQFMENCITKSNFVLLICTPLYKLRAEEHKGGVGYENIIITAELYKNIYVKKIFPILFSGTWFESTPVWVMGKLGVDLSTSEAYQQNLNKLVDRLKTKIIQGLSDYKEFLQTQLNDDENQSRDIIALMLKNNDETTEYFRISKNHAKIS